MLKKKNSNPVISAYPRGFEIVDFDKKVFRKFKPSKFSFPYPDIIPMPSLDVIYKSRKM